MNAAYIAALVSSIDDRGLWIAVDGLLRGKFDDVDVDTRPDTSGAHRGAAALSSILSLALVSRGLFRYAALGGGGDGGLASAVPHTLLTVSEEAWSDLLLSIERATPAEARLRPASSALGLSFPLNFAAFTAAIDALATAVGVLPSALMERAAAAAGQRLVQADPSAAGTVGAAAPPALLSTRLHEAVGAVSACMELARGRLRGGTGGQLRPVRWTDAAATSASLLPRHISTGAQTLSAAPAPGAAAALLARRDAPGPGGVAMALPPHSRPAEPTDADTASPLPGSFCFDGPFSSGAGRRRRRGSDSALSSSSPLQRARRAAEMEGLPRQPTPRSHSGGSVDSGDGCSRTVSPLMRPASDQGTPLAYGGQISPLPSPRGGATGVGEWGPQSHADRSGVAATGAPPRARSPVSPSVAGAYATGTEARPTRDEADAAARSSEARLSPRTGAGASSGGGSGSLGARQSLLSTGPSSRSADAGLGSAQHSATTLRARVHSPMLQSPPASPALTPQAGGTVRPSPPLRSVSAHLRSRGASHSPVTSIGRLLGGEQRPAGLSDRPPSLALDTASGTPHSRAQPLAGLQLLAGSSSSIVPAAALGSFSSPLAFPGAASPHLLSLAGNRLMGRVDSPPPQSLTALQAVPSSTVLSPLIAPGSPHHSPSLLNPAVTRARRVSEDSSSPPITLPGTAINALRRQRAASFASGSSSSPLPTSGSGSSSSSHADGSTAVNDSPFGLGASYGDGVHRAALTRSPLPVHRSIPVGSPAAFPVRQASMSAALIPALRLSDIGGPSALLLGCAASSHTTPTTSLRMTASAHSAAASDSGSVPALSRRASVDSYRGSSPVVAVPAPAADVGAVTAALNRGWGSPLGPPGHAGHSPAQMVPLSARRAVHSSPSLGGSPSLLSSSPAHALTRSRSDSSQPQPQLQPQCSSPPAPGSDPSQAAMHTPRSPAPHGSPNGGGSHALITPNRVSPRSYALGVGPNRLRPTAALRLGASFRSGLWASATGEGSSTSGSGAASDAETRTDRFTGRGSRSSSIGSAPAVASSAAHASVAAAAGVDLTHAYLGASPSPRMSAVMSPATSIGSGSPVNPLARVRCQSLDERIEPSTSPHLDRASVGRSVRAREVHTASLQLALDRLSRATLSGAATPPASLSLPVPHASDMGSANQGLRFPTSSAGVAYGDDGGTTKAGNPDDSYAQHGWDATQHGWYGGGGPSTHAPGWRATLRTIASENKMNQQEHDNEVSSPAHNSEVEDDHEREGGAADGSRGDDVAMGGGLERWHVGGAAARPEAATSTGHLSGDGKCEPALCALAAWWLAAHVAAFLASGTGELAAAATGRDASLPAVGAPAPPLGLRRLLTAYSCGDAAAQAAAFAQAVVCAVPGSADHATERATGAADSLPVLGGSSTHSAADWDQALHWAVALTCGFAAHGP